MALSERELLIQESNHLLNEFTRQNPAYSIDAVQPEYRGGTNYVTRGHRTPASGERQPIIFKYFVRTYRWRHELFCLRHLADTGLVPRVLDVIPETLIVMTRFADSGVESTRLKLEQRKKVSREIGYAAAKLVQWPLPSEGERPSLASEFEEFAWRMDIGDLLRECLSLCRQIHRKVPDFQTSFYGETLALMEAQIDYIDQQPRILYHEDFPNLSVYRGTFQGFYDFEMARIGTKAMQLGVAVDLCNPHWMEGEWLVWPDFVAGYQEKIGRTLTETDYLAALAMSHYYYHIRLTRWLKWDGDPANVEAAQFATSNAEEYHLYMKRVCHSLREWIDLKCWFPSLV